MEDTRLLRWISTLLILLIAGHGFCEDEKKEKYLFYLTSSSVPTISMQSVIEQSQKLNARVIIVAYGIDEDRVLLKHLDPLVNKMKFLFKPNPYIFDENGVKQVPALLTATCNEYNNFRSDSCEYEYIIYGDISLIGYLEILKDKDAYYEQEYRRAVQ